MQSKHNNTIELVQTDSSSLYKVKLNLTFETRFIGTLDSFGDGTFTTQRKPQHLFRKLNALGINQELLTSSDIFFKWILIDYEGKKRVTTRKYFLAKGKALKFSAQNFELQIFLPLSEFGIEKARLFEAKNLIQENLFGEAI